ncbi:MAG TPA: hypothetical protein VGP73_26190 [Thermoanaerobaculia bacterium]
MSETSSALTQGSPQAAPARLTLQSLSQEHDSWLHFVALSGEEGRDWAESFRQPGNSAVTRAAVASLGRLHRRSFAEGLALLEEAEAGLEAVRATAEASIVLALESIYFPLRAYYEYCVEAWDEALASLDRSDRTVAAAIARRPFLMPIAYRCSEFQLHRARIARNRGRWSEMRRQIDLAWEMMEGRQPLCERPDGGRVTVADLVAFFGSLPVADPVAAEYLRGLTDVEMRRELFDRFVSRIYALPGFVIPCP